MAQIASRVLERMARFPFGVSANYTRRSGPASERDHRRLPGLRPEGPAGLVWAARGR